MKKLNFSLLFLILPLLLLTEPKSYAQDNDSTEQNQENVDKQISLSLPDVGLFTEGIIWMSKSYYRFYHEKLDEEFKNDQRPYLMCGANDWLMENNKRVLTKGYMAEMKWGEKIYYVFDAKRHYNIDRAYKFCFLAAPGYYLPQMAVDDSTMNHGTVKETDIILNKGEDGHNYVMKPLKRPKNMDFEEIH